MDIIADWDSSSTSSNGESSTSGMSGSYEESLDIKRKDMLSKNSSTTKKVVKSLIYTEKRIDKEFTGFNSMKKIDLKKQLYLRLDENSIITEILSTGRRILDGTKKELIEEIEILDIMTTIEMRKMYENVAEGKVDGIASSDTSDSTTDSNETEVEPEFELEERHEKIISKFISITDKYLDNLNEKKDTAIDIETGVLDMFLETPIINK